MGIGVLLGMLSGYFGGWLDEGFMRLIDAVQGFPAILSALLFSAVFKPGIAISMVAIGIAFIPVFARLARGSFLELRDREFVLAARALGAGDAALILRHIFPNTLSPLIVQATISFPVAILAEAALAYLGLGTQPPHPSWGLMLKDAQNFLGLNPWYAVFPGPPLHVGRAEVRSWLARDPLFEMAPVPGGNFGVPIDAIGDINGDGAEEVMVGAPGDPTNGANSGFVRVLSGVNLTTLYSYAGWHPGQLFGTPSPVTSWPRAHSRAARRPAQPRTVSSPAPTVNASPTKQIRE
jgi:hypothetical protein